MNISFFLTTEQIRNSTPDNILKDVTRRIGWKNLKAGQILMACVKCQGLKKGEKIEKIRPIRVKSATTEELQVIMHYPYRNKCKRSEMEREGFPEMCSLEFIDMFTKEMNCNRDTTVTRIEFEYVDESDSKRAS